MHLELEPVVELVISSAAHAIKKKRADNEFPHAHEYFLLSGYDDPAPATGAPGFYSLETLADHNVARLLELHIGSLPLDECCAFFGGFVWRLNDEPILVPQCCGTLADIDSLIEASEAATFEDYLLPEGHPCPLLQHDGIQATLTCFDEYDPFKEPAVNSEFPFLDFRNAIEKAAVILQTFAQRLDRIAIDQGRGAVSETLVYEL